MTLNRLDGTFRTSGNAVIIDLEGDLNGSARERLGAIHADATSQRPACVVLNFTGVSYIDSMGISLIVGLLSDAQKTNRKLMVYGLSDHYVHIFEITRLAEYISIFDDEQKALESFSKQ